ncbi:MAG: hypothetical protein NUV77_02715 [Thermoguttaceae bacterium]|jgi:hypothetical protein|nr:hypothetical protein [Thermoguttaceae bacterium]
MDRRDFLKTGAQAAVWSSAVSAGVSAGSTQADPKEVGRTPAILKSYTAADHRRRLETIAYCHRAIRTCLRKHLVTDYLPAQCAYNLGEYPCRKPWDPDQYDEQELDRLREHGIQLLQVFDEWNDSLRLFGRHKLTALNPEGFRRFVQMVHQRGMKLLVYASSGYFIRTDPDFREEWSRPGDGFFGGYWNMVRCSPASPGWRAYLLPRVVQILDEYEVDGIYNDWGYVPNASKPPQQALAKDEVPAFDETPTYDGAVTDLLMLLYAEVKRRGGIVKLHADYANQPQTGGAKVYDYLWVGENVANADGLREAVKNHSPYVVPCIDLSFAKVENDDEPFLHAIPYMQFPLLQAGRPFTGERAMIPGVAYAPNPQDLWMRRCREAWKHYQANPKAFYTYGGWDAVPGRAETRPTHARWLRQYLPLVEEGTWAWLEIGQSSLFVGPIPQGVVASAFANRQMYLVLANYGRSPVELETADPYVPVADAAAGPRKRWALSARSLVILRRSA